MIKVFLVEDEIVMRNGIKNNIPWEKEGLEFAGEASDGELAYPLIRKVQPDILITDIRMPFMDGLELSELVKKEFPRIKIIILSGYNEFDYAKQAIHIGVTDYLLKPITAAKLLEAVKKVEAKMEQLRVADAITEIFNIFRRSNKYIDETTPWALAKAMVGTAATASNATRAMATVLFFMLRSSWLVRFASSFTANTSGRGESLQRFPNSFP